VSYVLSLQSRRLWLALAVVIAALLAGSPLRSQGSPCGPGINAIVCENFQPGDPASVWDISGSGDSTIQGYATDISVNHGGVVQFKIKTDAASYHLDVYRVGYYGGMGARKVATVLPSASLPQTQPACATDAATGLIDCGNWAVSASWTVPATAISGIYFARVIRNDSGGASHIVFIVRDDDGHSDLLFQTSDTTWQAYNNYGGNSLYVGQPAGRAYKVSYNRPFNNRSTPSGGVEGWLFSNEYPMVRWLEANGYNVSYTTGVDTDRRGAEILEHRVFLSVGHDEYWAAGQRANVEAARDAGVHVAFFSGNEVLWKTRWESSIAGPATTYRTLVSYKETHANAKIDPTSAWTGTWRDPRFSPPADGGRPENALTGTFFMVNGTRNDPMTVTAAQGAMRFWRNTTVASLQTGQTATFAAGLLGYEWDEAPDNSTTPAGLQRLSSTTIDVSPLYLQDYGSTYGSGTATHSLTLYRAPSGALVFGAGTVQYSWGLDATHDRVGPPADIRLQQATVNLFADMGVQAGSLRAGLVGASASLDSTAPTSTITSPVNGATVQSGTPITIAGTAADAGGGVVTSVDVSTDGGTTWRHASGSTSWSLTWTPSGPGSSSVSANIRSRAYDDSGNVETPGAGSTVTVTPIGGLVASYGFNEGSGTIAADVSGNGNTGTISGAAWTQGRADGALLFNGTSDWVTINDVAALHLTTGMTLEAWVKPNILSGWRSVILKEAPPSTLAYSLYANDNVPRPATTIRVPAGDLSAAGTSGIPLNQWTHLASSYDGATIRLYVNGTQVAQTSTSGSMVSSTAPLRIGGNAIWGEYFAGAIDEVRVYRRALAASEIQADMNTPVGGGPIPDTTAPTVSLTAPASGATVGGTATTVSASATDNVGVAGVQFLIDGASLGAEDASAPYSISWNTTGATDGSHTLSARARDAAGNTALATNVSVIVNNTPDSTLPTVSITAPTQGATVSGTTTVSVNASDNVAVAGVTLLVDNVQTGAEDTIAPYSWSWNTASVSNGSHTLTARARDNAGNSATSSPVTVTVSNTAPPPMGLVAAYSFDEGAGSTVGDSSGGGNVGTINGATWTVAGKYGKALTFNGTSNWVTVPDASSLDLTTGMTIEAWVNPTAVSGYQETLVKEATGDITYALYANNGTPAVPGAVVSVGAAQRTAPGTTAIVANTWTHVAATYDGSTVRMFVNGVQTGTASISGSLNVTTGPLRIGGNAVWGEYFSGRIDEVRVYNRALTAAEIQTDMNTSISPPIPPDTTPPTVSITAPAAGQTVTGTMKIKATASDASGIAGVQFKVDGANYSPEDTTAPYEIDWNPGALSNGNHTLFATARDAAGNVSTTMNTVNVSLPTGPANVGAWSAPVNLGFVAVHMVLLDTGKVLMWPGWANAIPMASVFDPATNQLTSTPVTTGSNIFSSGHVTLADGRVLIAGGHDDANGILGLQHANIFNPATLQWTRLPDMAFRRWHPTATMLSDGKVLVTSGATTCATCLVDVPELYDPVTNTWTQLTSAALSVPTYPMEFILPSGKLMYTGSTELPGATRTLDVATQTWQTVDAHGVDGGSAVMFAPGKMMQAGLANMAGLPTQPATTTTYVIDGTQPAPVWRQTAPLAYARTYHNLVTLPDGSVLAVGGESLTDGTDITKSVYAAELWSPVTETWSTMASGAIPRLYHSTTLLLPDGRVLVAGSGEVTGGVDQNQAEYYSPPYLFKGSRPSITSAPAQIEYGSSFFVATPDAASIASVALVRDGAVTHGFDEDQRFVSVTFSQVAGGLQVTAPADSRIAPPGQYMLFIVNTNGVPSVAPFVRFPAPYEDAVPPSAPGSLTATGGIGSVALSWTAATDNLGVTGYNVHRSTVSGFTPTTANRIAQRTTLSYTDSGLTPGTYYYVVTAQDAAGNVGAPSNQATGVATSDTINPTASITAPANGATVSGTTTVTASASDNVGVAGVQFLLDGAALGAEDITSPFSIAWDTKTASNGTHTLSARARDAAGNLGTSATVTVTVSNIAAAGLIAAYAFEEGTGTTTADATGKSHTGTVSGATWTTTGKNGKALAFNGLNSFVSAADANDLDLTNGMTLEAWVNPASLSGWNTVVMKEGSTTTLAYSLYANDGSPWPSITVRINSVDRKAVGTSSLPLNTWTHLAATYDGANLRLYVNGVQVGSRAQTGNMLVSTRTLRIGGNSVWGEYFNGIIDDVRVYNRALTAAEIQTDMNTPVN
jgi:hypothetical protein